MEPARRPRVKICCISSVEEGRLAIRCGAAALGLVSDMPSGPGVIPEPLIGEIAATIPPGIASFLLTSRQSAVAIIDQQRRMWVNTIQMCDHLTDGTYQHLRDALPGVSLVQVIHVTGEASIAEAAAVAPLVDGILLDSGSQTLAVKELGGTGRRHDWQISRRIRETIGVPLYLAGGLRPENVAEAIDTVGPFGLDICNGVRTDGRLDEVKLVAFFEAVRAATRHPRAADARHAARS
ncbi:MAG: phosphoribosylanthranilate isomerase [Acidobacteria bacterium]|nr:phosphoribosylanthranilate isomerase [Acidobacteriota bacterium]